MREIGVSVQDETENDFLSFCPYHGNSDSPAFSTSKRYGYSICFNPACAVGTDDAGGPLSLIRLAKEQLGVNRFEAQRLIYLKKNSEVSFKDRFDSVKLEEEELKEFSSSAIDKMHARLLGFPPAIEYLEGRGLELETLKYFKVGFTPETITPVRKPDMIVVPAYDHRSRPVGLVGRSLVGKVFRNFGTEPNGTGFHKSKIVWNLNNARRYETVIVCESTFDAMRIHQAGYPNVVALLGGTLSETQEALLKRHFSRVIIMTDNETGSDIVFHRHCRKCIRAGSDMCRGHKPGRELGMQIAERLPNIRISWATYDDRSIYARDVKDASDMTEQEIVQCLRNAISHYEYLDWVA